MNETNSISVYINDGVNDIMLHAQKGELLLDVLRRSGKPISAPCGGKGTCGKCTVDIRNVGSKLACQFFVHADIFVDLPGAQHFAILDKSYAAKCIAHDSGIVVHIEDNHRIVFYRGEELYREKFASPSTEKYGLAIDIGSTTVVMFLEDLTSFEIVDVISFVNPQSAYGGDVISRITHCIENKDGLSTLHNVLVEKLNEAIIHICLKNDINSQYIVKSTIVGNTVMQHILCGVDPRSIAFAPYTPVFIEEKRFRAQELYFKSHPNGIVTVLPSIAGYVGADIVAGIATTDVMQRDGYTLYLDIGTNGEIALGNKDKIYCCATAAGPAFEGANIECGIGGVTGAISEYQNNEYTMIGNGKPIGICGSGLIDIVAALLDQGRIDKMGYMEDDFIVAPKSECAIDRDIVLTPQDVREVQLAKSAIHAGITTLMKVAGIDFDQIERLYLAGGFGNYIRVESGIRIGLLPKELKDRIVPIGNAAGTGARFALKSIEFEKEIQRVIQKSEYIELSMRQDFNEAYVAAMMFE
jgi:uncharacterized 2Fe-2S/4Fe-4S cluster protein (DUF4445 family)